MSKSFAQPNTGDARVELQFESHFAMLTLNRPEKLNALDFEMLLALQRAADLIDQSEARVAIITGAGEKSFCAGGDIEAWSSWPQDDFGWRWVKQGHRSFDALARLKIPMIAALNGHCLGGGLELATVADFRIAEVQSKMGLPETSLGIIPGWSGTQRAVRRFGAQVVRRMALGGEIFQGDDVLALGLADQVVAKGEALNAARAMAEKISQRSPKATALTKLMINIAEGEEREASVETLGGLIAASSDELKIGVAAFKGKVKPEF